MKRICGIYQIKNIINNKRYIGLSQHCLQRFSQHKTALRHNRHCNVHLQAAWNKYGENNFEFSILEILPESDLAKREIYWIEYYDSYKHGYNRSGGGDGTSQVIHTEQRNRQLSATLAGRKRPELSGGKAFNAKAVVCLNTGERFECMKDAAKNLKINYGGVLRSCSLRCTVGDGLVFMYGDEYDALSKDEIKTIIQESNDRKKQRGSTVHVICLNTREEFTSVKKAAEKFNIHSSTTIRDACAGVQQTAGIDEYGNPLVWMYASDYYNGYAKMSDDEVLCYIQSKTSAPLRHYKVICRDTHKEYASVLSASKDAGITHTGLHYHLHKHGFYYNKEQNATYEYLQIS